MAKKSGDDKRPIEQYEHADKTRVNNPPVGLVTPATDPDSARKVYEYDPHLDPQLVWAGKAEHASFEVPTVSLHVHERIDPRTIIRAVQKRNGDAPRPSPNVHVRGTRGEPAPPRGHRVLQARPWLDKPADRGRLTDGDELAVGKGGDGWQGADGLHRPALRNQVRSNFQPS